MTGMTASSSLAGEVFPSPELSEVWLKPIRLVLKPAESPFWGRKGWARFTRKVVLTDTRPADQTVLGQLLSAEWVDEHERSCRVELDPICPGQFVMFTLEESAAELPGYQRAWREVEMIEGGGPASGKVLTYHVYLSEKADGEIHRWCDAFWGWRQA
jgi:hypothetical protein